MVALGKLNNLEVKKIVDFGVYLDGEELGEILMPQKYVPENTEIGDVIQVFVYKDSEDRLIATTEIPYAMVDDYAKLEVVAVTKFGAFLDWGLQKDLFVPFKEQKSKMENGKSYVVHIYIDEETQRIAATSKIEKTLNKVSLDYEEGEKVILMIYNKTDLGYKAIINNSHIGVLYENEVFEKLNQGDKIEGFIKKIRSDGKLDLRLYEQGGNRIDDFSDILLKELKDSNGYLAYSDKTSPDLIYKRFGVSKKTFKKAIGALYKQKIITIENDGIRLLK